MCIPYVIIFKIKELFIMHTHVISKYTLLNVLSSQPVRVIVLISSRYEIRDCIPGVQCVVLSLA